MPRREFTRTVKAQIVHRAMNEAGQVVCESCDLVLAGKRYEIHHTTPDAMEIDKSRKLTAEDGQLLGVECCHRPKTKIDVKNIAKAKRRESKHLGFKRSTSRPLPGTKASGIRKRMNGQVERW